MKTHKDLFAWQKARLLTTTLYRFLCSHWSPSAAVICDQLRRAALSVPLNLAEGFASGPGARCKYHYRIAYASAVETTELLELWRDVDQKLAPQLTSMILLSREGQALTMLLLQNTKG